jgi:hypothetical protein
MIAKTELAHGWVSPPDERGTINIVWSCIATIFLCSWSVLFLNIPTKPGLRTFLTTKLSWVAFTIFFPEVLAAFAQQQWILASQSVSDFSRLGYSQWSLRHAFFADMGGFVLETPDYLPFPIDAYQLHYLVANNLMAFPIIDENAIQDKNKADGFARMLTSIQVLWFALQCLGRPFPRSVGGVTSHWTLPLQSQFFLETKSGWKTYSDPRALVQANPSGSHLLTLPTHLSVNSTS